MTIRRLLAVLPVVLLMLVAANPASALITQTFQPVDASGAGDSNLNDLEDLDHYFAYRWGLNYSIPAGHDLVSASLTFKNIRNWDSNPNRLYIRLLDTTSAMVGVTKFSDNPNDNVFHDYFSSFSPSIHLHTYENLSTTAQTRTYNLDASELATLATYMADGYFGFGFDPDCHFWNDGITLKLKFEPTPPGGGNDEPGIPEPVTASLGMLSAAGLFLSTHRRRNA